MSTPPVLKLAIVEDDEIDRLGCIRLLKKAPKFTYEITECATGKEGLELTTKTDLDLILLDFKLPDIDGLEFLNKIAEMSYPCAIIMLTGHGNEEVAVKALKSGASDYISKDTMTGELLNQTIASAVTARQLENERRLRTEAENRNQAKTNFLSRVSHELRTPMNAIIGFSEIMEANSKDPLSDGQRKNLSFILNSAEHLLNLINEILDLNSIEAGKLKVSLSPVQLCLIISDLTELVQPSLKKLEIVLNDRISQQRNLFVTADPLRLKQVLLNLVSNAIKYNRKGGSVTLDYELMDNDIIRISVTDNGVGLSQDKSSTLFEPFNRFGAEYSDIEGTGIGLSISKGLVELMNGKIGYEDQDPQGSCFYIEIPMISDLND
jgi:signal transduction histidine kinase